MDTVDTVTFVYETKEEAEFIAKQTNGEVHALVIIKGFTARDKPVAYMVVPKEKDGSNVS